MTTDLFGDDYNPEPDREPQSNDCGTDGCCEACNGKGWTLGDGVCWDCRGSGHCHPLD